QGGRTVAPRGARGGRRVIRWTSPRRQATLLHRLTLEEHHANGPAAGYGDGDLGPLRGPRGELRAARLSRWRAELGQRREGGGELERAGRERRQYQQRQREARRRRRRQPGRLPPVDGL